MAEPFTIRVFVPDGDPEGVRVIDRLNWTGVGIVFPRGHWAGIRQRPEFARPGVYLLVGFEEEDDRPQIYIGQADGVRGRIDSHIKEKQFWEWAAVFTSSSGGLNRAHVTWIEFQMIARAKLAGRCVLDNGSAPQEPALSDADRADTEAFLKEVLQILPLVNLRVFEMPNAVARPAAAPRPAQPVKGGGGGEEDTVIVPAKADGFTRVFLGENCWYQIRIAPGRLDKIRYIAAYRSKPVQAITHWAPVKEIVPYGNGGKYRLIFAQPAKELSLPVKWGAPGPAHARPALYQPCQAAIGTVNFRSRLAGPGGKR